jgi:hypothetical protein
MCLGRIDHEPPVVGLVSACFGHRFRCISECQGIALGERLDIFEQKCKFGPVAVWNANMSRLTWPLLIFHQILTVSCQYLYLWTILLHTLPVWGGAVTVALQPQLRTVQN